MPANLFSSIMSKGDITLSAFLIATFCSLLSGFIIAGMYMVKSRYSKSLIISLVVLPCIVQIVIMLVNGNIGTGIAVAGAFSLVRFRSAAGNGREISWIFLAMSVGLATGMGYVFLALLFALLISLVELMLNLVNFGGEADEARNLRIFIPESLDYEGKFDDIFDSYLKRHDLMHVKTCNMGTMYRLEYDIVMLRGKSIKEFMDKLRERNGNLEISVSRMKDEPNEL